MLTLTWHHGAAVFKWLQEGSAACSQSLVCTSGDGSQQHCLVVTLLPLRDGQVAQAAAAYRAGHGRITQDCRDCQCDIGHQARNALRQHDMYHNL